MNDKQINMRQEVIDHVTDNDGSNPGINWRQQMADTLALDGFDMNSDEHFCMFLPTGTTEIDRELDEPDTNWHPCQMQINFDFSYLLEDGKKYDEPRLIIATGYTWPSLCYNVMARYGDYLVAIEGDRSGFRIRQQQVVLHKTGVIVATQDHYGRTASMHKAARTLAKHNVQVGSAVDYVRNMYN